MIWDKVQWLMKKIHPKNNEGSLYDLYIIFFNLQLKLGCNLNAFYMWFIVDRINFYTIN